MGSGSTNSCIQGSLLLSAKNLRESSAETRFLLYCIIPLKASYQKFQKFKNIKKNLAVVESCYFPEKTRRQKKINTSHFIIAYQMQLS